MNLSRNSHPLLITMIFGKKLIEYLRRRQIGESVRSLYLDGQNQKAGTPTMGGIIIISSILVPVLLLCDICNIYVILLIFTTLWLGAIGFADDYIKVFKHNKDGLSSRAKLFGQITLGVVIGIVVYMNDDIPNSLKTTVPFLKNNEFDYSKIVWFLDMDKYGWDADPWVWVYEFERVEVE